MSPAKVFVLRAAVVAALLTAMPLVVLPPVVAQIDALIYREDPRLLPQTGYIDQFEASHSLSIQNSTPPIERRLPEAAATRTEYDRRFDDAQARLRALGANYMTLQAARAGESTSETDGATTAADERVFRFHCRVSLAASDSELADGKFGRSELGSSEYEAFEALDHDPVAAMEQVLREVEAWQGPLEGVQTAELLRRLR